MLQEHSPTTAPPQSTASPGSGSGPTRTRARLLLVLSAALFGSAFAPSQIALDHLTPGGLVLFRFGVATLVCLPLARWRGSDGAEHTTTERPTARHYLAAGAAAGLLNAFGFMVLSAALERTTASNTAFLSSLFVVIVPLLAALQLRRAPGRPVLVAIGFAVLGSFLLSGASLSIGSGDLLAVGDAFIASGHILVVAHFAPRLRPMPFNLVQLAVAGLAVAPIAIVGGVGELALSAVVAAVWCGIAQGAALALQVVAQRSVDSTSSALILLLVPVTGAALSYVLVGDRMGAVGIVGALLILTAVIVAEVLPTLRAGRRGAAALGVEPSP